MKEKYGTTRMWYFIIIGILFILTSIAPATIRAANNDVIISDGGALPANTKIDSGNFMFDNGTHTLTVNGTSNLTGATTVNGTTNINNNNNAATNINTGTSTSTVTIGNAANITTLSSGTTGIYGTTLINNNYNAATSINTGTSTSAVTIGNSANTTTVNSGTTNINSITNVTGATTITGATSINNNNNAATNINTGTSTSAVTIGNSANTTALNSSTNNIGTGAYATTNTIGSTQALTTVTALGGNSTMTVVNGNSSLQTAGALATSNLSGATVGTSGGTSVVMKGTTASQAVVDTNGKISIRTGAATESTAALTLTNGRGDTHGVVVTESKTVLSGGEASSSLTLSDTGATFSNSSTGGPTRVHGIDDGIEEFDAVNYGQLRQAYQGIAAVSALSAIPPPAPGKYYAIGVGYGNFEKIHAFAVGLKGVIGQEGAIAISAGIGCSTSGKKIGKTATTSVGVNYSF